MKLKLCVVFISTYLDSATSSFIIRHYGCSTNNMIEPFHNCI